MSLARLTYVSDSNKLIEWSLVKEILEVAQPKNQRLCVSGILLSHGMNFLQRLEGEQQIIEELYQSILNDSPTYQSPIARGHSDITPSIWTMVDAGLRI